MRKLGALIVGIVLTATCAASAQEACRAEAEKFCKDVQHGEGRLLKCLQGHEADLSVECRARLNTINQFMACIDDVMHLCPGNEPVGGEAIKCLRLHETDLSTACKNELRKIRPQ
jgi:hypothetical protein